MTSTHLSQNRLALGAACLASLMFGLEISSVPVILPTLEKMPGGTFEGLQWIMNAYTIAVTTVLMATGTLADRFGRKRLFIIGIALFGIASVACGLAPSVPLLIVGRLLQGASGGAMLICQVAVLSHQFPAGRARAKAFSAWGVILGIGLGFGPIIGGAIVAALNWQWVFLVHGVLAVVTLALAIAGVEESRDPHADRLDIAGIVTLSLAVFGLVFLITRASDLTFGGAARIAIPLATAACFVAFVCAEKWSARPMFDFSVFRIRPFSGALVGSAAMNVSFWPFMIYLPIYFQVGLGYDSVTAGLALLAYTLPTLCVPPLGERLVLRYGPGNAIPFGLFTIGLGFMLMRFGSASPHASWATMLPGCLIAGIGLGLTNTPVTNTTTASVPAARAGMASGIDMSARMISLAINIALMGGILMAGIVSRLKTALPTGSLDDGALGQLAGHVAAGDVAAVHRGFPVLSAVDPSGAALHAALVHGFGCVMLYGGCGVWLLALLSYVVAGRESRARGSDGYGHAALQTEAATVQQQSVRCDASSREECATS
ncbi:MFS transporter [Paraburkholderia phosphatilytica]|uniref:MFS transporter n=1 Tax=Paraburkholderia phosphatilytica TaxID=2282883 RepID=UPI000E5331C7|nr:MFS transporter [Paraburkholderia phosphatilytica]